MLTTAAVIKMSLMVTDAKGYKAYVPMPVDEALAIVATCAPTSAPDHCAAVLTVLSFRESGNTFTALHDGGRGCGAFGVLCTYPHGTWLEQVSSAWSQVLRSTQTCTEALALYCSGSCTRGTKVAREYLEMARRIVREVTPPQK